MPVKEVLYAYLHAILSRRIIALLWKGVPLYRSPNRLLGRVNINRCLCQVVKLLLISLPLSFCPPSGKLFFSITIENPFLHIRLLLYDTFLTGSIFFFRTVNQLSCIIEKTFYLFSHLFIFMAFL